MRTTSCSWVVAEAWSGWEKIVRTIAATASWACLGTTESTFQAPLSSNSDRRGRLNALRERSQSSLIGPHPPDDSLGELSLVGPPGFLLALALRPLASEELLRRGQMPGLGHRHRVEDPVHLPVAQEIEPVTDRLPVALARGNGDRRNPAPSGEAALGLEARRFAHSRHELRSRHDADPELLGERRAAGIQQRRQAILEFSDASLPLVQICGELGEPVQHLGE